MATQGPTNLPAYFSSNADFQAWVQGIHNAISALGFVQTADSGQIAPATVAAPAATNAVQGYEIWRFSDTLQATVPIFFKIEYGASAGNMQAPGLWLTAGSGSNGTGGLTGQVSARYNGYAGNNKTAGVQLPLYACSDGSDLFLLTNLDTSSTTFGISFMITRPRDQNGAATGDGFVIASWSGGSSYWNNIFMPPTGGAPAASGSNFPGVNPAFYNRSTGGENADVCPFLAPINGNWRYARVLVYNNSDFGMLGTFTTVLFGASHTFMAIGQTGGNPQPSSLGNLGGSASNIGFAIPWE